MGKVQRPPFVPFTVPTHGTSVWDKFIVHTTEGAETSTIEGLAEFFRNHPQKLGITYIIEKSGRMGSMLAPRRVVYHVKGANTVARGVELVGTAHFTSRLWFLRLRQLWAVAWLMAWVNQEYLVPLVKQGEKNWGSRGFYGHGDVPGNDHWDPGPNFPWGFVLKLARKWAVNGVPRHVRLAIPRR